MGFEYATKGTMTVDGRKIVLITKDDQTKPDVAKTLLAEAYEDDKVDTRDRHDRRRPRRSRCCRSPRSARRS